MSATRIKVAFPLAGAIAALLIPTSAQAAPEPTKYVLSRHIGLKVDETTGGNICTVASGDKCKNGEESSEPGAFGFDFPEGIAVSQQTGDVYVADKVNRRVQELTAEGVFLAMFGWEVNATKDAEAGATQAEKNVCTATSHDVCQPGVSGEEPGQFARLRSLAVDPVTGDVYVADSAEGEINGETAFAERVQQFTAAGVLVAEIGKEVNETTKANICVVAEAGVKCKGAAFQTPAEVEANPQPGSFNFETQSGDLLASGGPEHLLYVGDQGRVQKFKPSGEAAGAIELASTTAKATAIAVSASGVLFVVEEQAAGVHVYNANGELQPSAIDPAAGAIAAIAVNARGDLAVIENEKGTLYNAAGVKLSQFAPPSGKMFGPKALAFGPGAALYVIDNGGQEVEAYAPEAFPLATTCAASEVAATSARLCGEVDPDEMPTTASFAYGISPGALNAATPTVFSGEGAVFAPIAAQLAGLVPNQAYFFKAVAAGELSGEPRISDGEEEGFHTPIAPPQVLGEPTVGFLTSDSVVLDAALNPEHTPTTYHFELGPCSALPCPAATTTTEQESAQFGEVGVAQEATRLLPATTYRYRLMIENEAHQQATGSEGSFTTAAAPAATATTGTASAITATTALLAGAVDPDGEEATYSFELGIWNGAATEYGLVQSASAGAASTVSEHTLSVTGLQPGTTYAYRIAIAGGHSRATGATATFATPGVSSVLTVPTAQGLLSIPAIPFPTNTKPAVVGKPTKCKYGSKRAHGRSTCKPKPKKHFKHSKRHK